MAEHLFAVWDKAEKAIRNHFILLFLDYDGTLTSITRSPDLAKLNTRQHAKLEQLTHVRELELAIVSGRPLPEIKKLVNLPEITYAGNHGLEFEGPQIKYTHPGALRAMTNLHAITGQFKQVFGPFPGILVENKVLTLSVHYRQLAPDKVQQARTLFMKTIDPYLQQSTVLFTEGKKVWEVRPNVDWDKGNAVIWLWERRLASHAGKQILPIYIGDDKTDESAFKALQNRGMGVCVTEKTDAETHAGYYLSSPDEVYEFLDRLKAIKEEERL